MIVGAGGLGSPVAIYLTALGIGKIGIIDYDKVEISNLALQLIFTSIDVIKKKKQGLLKRINKSNTFCPDNLKILLEKIAS